MNYFTSDTHFNHENCIIYCDRPFENSNEMNEVIIDNWNSRVNKKDTVYHLGDFGFGDVSKIVKRLNGKIVLCLGDHDKSALSCKELFEKVTPLLNTKLGNTYITLCHWQMKVWAKSHYNSWNLYGHSHNKSTPEGKSFDVGVDCWDFKLLSQDQVTDIMSDRPDNFNLVRR